MLVCIGRSDRRNKNGDLVFEIVRCDCGVVKDVIRSAIVGNKAKSCGCSKGQFCARAKTKHGHTNSTGYSSRTYKSWSASIARCENPKHKSYHRYGGRGIVVCSRWRESFEAFLDDMGERPPGMTLDRINNDGNYEKGNCRWATSKVQGRSNYQIRLVSAFGQTMPIVDWAEVVGIKQETIAQRLNSGWSEEDALSKSVSSVRAGWGNKDSGPRRRMLASDDGRVMHLAAWARELGLSVSTLHSRLKRGWKLGTPYQVA